MSVSLKCQGAALVLQNKAILHCLQQDVNMAYDRCSGDDHGPLPWLLSSAIAFMTFSCSAGGAVMMPFDRSSQRPWPKSKGCPATALIRVAIVIARIVPDYALLIMTMFGIPLHVHCSPCKGHCGIRV